MKENFPHMSLAKLCGWFGITRQAYYQRIRAAITVALEEELIIHEVNNIRAKHQRIGTRKLYLKMQPFMHEHRIKMGRDALFNLLSVNNLLVRKRKRRITTTHSYHRFKKYPNLIRDFCPAAPNKLWVSDITYWKITDSTHLYISFITDAYSHKIVSHQLAETLEARASVKALRVAIKANGGFNGCLDLIHHSDRGVQYCSAAYVKLLQDNKIKISMTENGDPLENAVAERVNGIIKEEYLDNYKVKNIKEAKKVLDCAIKLYNDDRPHMSIGNLTPSEVHNSSKNMKTEKLWKNYYRKNTTFVNHLQD